MQMFIDSGYYATLCGRVFNKAGKELRTNLHKNGYNYYGLYSGGVQKTVGAHRFIWSFFFGPIPSNLVIDHINSNRVDNRLVNLRLLTPRENQRLVKAKVTKEEVLEIRRSLSSGCSGKELAEKYGLAPQTICNIKKGRTWKDVC